ncbi:PilW family protein [Halomonas sp. KO116]|uniref:PilW family protein n=1 Tax=Halomonas sp. KO116 TaxID=1504981 RepID=UPI0004E2D608|nr:prepilin-type N-terminal cleavage/methylation domain-containing protein [Halomonas sp. KO116]AJY49406.1 hypothetical protein KO116_00907 [Halomonas sp. KO116]
MNKQQGFTLVELMVAMVIGSVIILGAGQLFLTTFQTFKKVDELSRKQESLIFIAQKVTSEIRQIDPDKPIKIRYTLECRVDDQSRCNCTVYDTNYGGKESEEPMVSFFKDLPPDDVANSCIEDADQFIQDTEVNGVAGRLYLVSLPLERNGGNIEFHVVVRQSIIDSISGNIGEKEENEGS